MFFRDIGNLEQELLSTASIREIAFFNFLINSGVPDFDDEESSEIDSMIVSILLGKRAGLEDQIEAIVRTKNRKRLDYRKSLIILIAFGLYDLDRFRSDIKAYISTCSLRDSYLLSKVFEEIKPEYNKVTSSPIDILVNEILINENFNQGSYMLEKALSSVKDILDLYIVKEAYKKLGENNFEETETFETMRTTINVLNEWIGSFYIIRFLIVFWMAFLPVIIMVGKVISTYSDIAEQYAYIGGIVSGMIANSLLLMNKSLNIQSFRDKIKSKNLKKIYKKNNLNSDEIEKIIRND